MEGEICTISIGNGFLDDDYTFYENGRIKRLYDKSTHQMNIEEWLEAKDLSESKKQKLLEKCDINHKDRVKNILK